MATNINFNSALGIAKNSIVITSSGGLDPDAEAFIIAAGITDATQITAVNQLVLDLKGYNIWGNVMALYPFVGGTAFTHKFNLKNPLDTDAAFRIVFNGGWTHSSNGVQPNGVNAWGDTFFRPNLIYTINPDINKFHLGYYSRTNSVSGADIGGANSGYSRGFYIMPNYAVNQYINVFGSTSTVVARFEPSTGFIMLRRNNNSTTIKSSQNGFTTAFNQNSTLFGQYSMAISGIRMNNNTTTFYSNRQLAFASIGYDIDDIQAANFNTAVQAFQTTLGRNV
jgi:hypothetical protein